jgi:hypothetical protein
LFSVISGLFFIAFLVDRVLHLSDY